jgi:replicative DNA helicase
MADGLFAAALRLPPANLEAEQALLGALLANNKAYERVGGALRPEHFADPVHAQVFGAIQRRLDAGQLADVVTLRAEFEHSGLLDDVGGVGYLVRLLSAMTGIINAGDYARVIRDAWLRRQMIAAGTDLVNASYCGAEDHHRDAQEILGQHVEAAMALADVRGDAGARSGAEVGRSMMAQVLATIERRGALPGISWGLRGLDRMTGGHRPTQLIIVGGRPSMGKTAFGLKATIGAARTGKRVLFISAEMDSEAVMARAVVAAAGLPLSAFTHGMVPGDAGRMRQMTEGELHGLDRAAAEIGGLPIVWDDVSKTVPAIRMRAMQMQRVAREKGGGLDLVVVDYLGRLDASQQAERFGPTVAGTELAKGLKDIAKTLGVPVIALHQLNRAVEQREDKTPRLSDLRDSGALEQEADLVVFLYREHYYLVAEAPQRSPKERAQDFDERVATWGEREFAARGKAVAIVAKQRQGPRGPVRLRFNDENAQFGDEIETDETRNSEGL